MKAIFLVAGNGVRMRPLTLTKPKPLLEVAGKPLIYHLVSKLPEAVDEIILVVGYLGDQIKNYCKDEFLGKKVSYVEQENQRGTYHAVSLCYPLVYNDKDKRFFVFYGDDLIDAETIRKMTDYEQAVLVSEVADPRRFGVVVLNEDGSVKEIIEKPENPPTNTVLANGLLLTNKIFQYPPPYAVNSEYYLSTAVAEMAKHEKVMAVKANFWFPIATPEDMKYAEEALQSRS
ncbi:MAG: Nucleotidyl transferase [Candidatus Jorgensenbacteria bacterium GW2011_GWA1_48_13]|uniref:Nucleotidyl transferase n=2 Tax=Candidatus Joergenseniibacteriota TaxID=1752739 RepID=A0A0G1W9V3_9BACT|nr:MAG: Nucleotidyl transferase [Candidatus Jorgensenbacteria bacterium GW2011_GWA1_48_13]KKW15380.1 MAG: Nucleotidyl transferase [Candidatus Jorgensenbacteria bacterium GW2011_GWB1_50_10]